ncbi:NUDIX hydrolase [Cytobacillus sp. IB215665]|uniref:NUDIX hydrolase n=1 Tax=Cytobacillus sp. IB215665 TaxID=3097357 RepID=UPI002A1622C0|nr:NUDIX hydrolase [Cytobacillus sp. IB215665]MDX8366755.1 NUDIX hydrolase [Cytobacillus sp. IB215665]
MKRVDVAYVLIFDEHEEQVLLVKNKGEKTSYYTLPGGAVEQEETLQDAAIREVREETGFVVELDGIFSISEAFFEESGNHAVFFTFRGKIIGGEMGISLPEEIEEITWMESSKAEQYVHITNEKGLIKSKSSAPYLLRGRVSHKY